MFIRRSYRQRLAHSAMNWQHLNDGLEEKTLSTNEKKNRLRLFKQQSRGSLVEIRETLFQLFARKLQQRVDDWALDEQNPTISHQEDFETFSDRHKRKLLWLFTHMLTHFGMEVGKRQPGLLIGTSTLMPQIWVFTKRNQTRTVNPETCFEQSLVNAILFVRFNDSFAP